MGVRIDVPSHLQGVKRVLDEYGYVLKKEIGQEFKRNIKFDDMKRTLYMDICPHDENEWLRVDYDLAQEEMALVKPRTASARSRFSSTGSAAALCSETSSSPAFSSALSSQEWTSTPSTSTYFPM